MVVSVVTSSNFYFSGSTMPFKGTVGRPLCESASSAAADDDMAASPPPRFVSLTVIHTCEFSLSGQTGFTILTLAETTQTRTKSVLNM